jgi:hypothetical protein
VGNVEMAQSTTVEASEGSIVAARGITNSRDLILDFSGGAFRLAVSEEQQDQANPSNASNVRSAELTAGLSDFIDGVLGLDLQAVQTVFVNPAANVLGQESAVVLDVALFEEELTLFSRQGEGVAFPYAQCEEVAGCAPGMNQEEMETELAALEDRIQELGRRLRQAEGAQRQKLAAELEQARSERQELASYKQEMEEFLGIEEQLDDDFEELAQTQKVDEKELDQNIQVIETRYTRVQFLESLLSSKKRRQKFAEQAGLELTDQELERIIESTLQAAKHTEAKIEEMLGGGAPQGSGG